MRELSQKLSFRSFLTLGPYEEDPEFRELLESVALRGLSVAAVLGIVSIIIFVSSHIIFLERTVVWVYSETAPETEIMLLDKGLILLFSLVCLLLARTSLSLFWSRSLFSFVIWFACLAVLLDDIASRDISFSTAYITFVLMVAVGTMPYKGWQTSLLMLVVIVTTHLTVISARDLLGIPAVGPETPQMIYLILMAVLLTGLSSLLYLNRYEQFQAYLRVEQLKEKLKERARVLEMMKEKSDKQAELLRKNEKLKDRFFANISHEFRTPLTLILGPLKDLLQGEREQDQKKVRAEVLSLMYKNGQRLLELINQLLDLSKIDAGEISLHLQEVNLAEFIPAAVMTFVPLAETRQVQLSCSIDDEPVVARIDPQQMERVIGNLVSNALKFTPEEGNVKVTVSQEDSGDRGIQICVTDSGVGIPQDELPYIFDRFYQAAHSPDMSNTGTGIGLALAKEIVDLHGGEIRVSSEPGSGSTFAVNLYADPEFQDEAVSVGKTLLSEPAWALSKTAEPESWITEMDTDAEGEGVGVAEADAPVVLLIDDNPDILYYLDPYLSQRYNVIATESSSEALQLIGEKQIDLIISDVMMPEPDGFELCRMVKEDPERNHIPIILLTAQAAEESRIEGLELGADDYISKPFSASELMVRVENLIELRRILRDKYSQEVHIKGKKVEVSSEDARFLKRVQSVIEDNMGNSNFGVDWLAGEVNLSSRQLQRKIRSVTNLSAGGYIRMIRLERASQLLAQQWGNVSEIAYDVGFQDTKYFSRLFKQTFGTTPTEYADRHR